MARFPFFNRSPKPETRNTTWDLKGETLLDLIKKNMDSDIDVTPSAAMKFTGVLAAVSLRSQLLASFPKMIYRNVDMGRESVFDDPLYKLLAHQPNPFMNSFTFWELVNTHLDLWGNAYVYISRYGGTANALTPISPDKVKILVDKRKMVYRVDGTKDPILDKDHSPDRFLHFKDISLDGIIGKSRISLAADAILLGLQQEDFEKDFFSKGGHSKAVIEVPGTLGDDGFQGLKKSLEASQNFGTIILDNGKSYKPVAIPMADAELIAAREFQLQDIARIFNVPPYLLADLSRATYSNLESADLSFVKYSLRPMVKRYEAELENKLLGDRIGEYNIRFNLDGILRGDTATRAEYISKMIQNEVITKNEARGLENLNKVPEGDVFKNPAINPQNSNNNGQNN